MNYVTSRGGKDKILLEKEILFSSIAIKLRVILFFPKMKIDNKGFNLLYLKVYANA
jgi:hypothetical protein